MTTSTEALGTPDGNGLQGGNVPSAFLPDQNLLARLANEFFQALPGRVSTPSVAQDVHASPPLSTLPIAEPLAQHGEFASLPVAPYVPPTSGFSLPTDTDLRPAPASVAGLTGLPSPAAAPAQPGAESSYYFLETAGLGLPGVAATAKPPATPPVQFGSQPAAVTPPVDGELRRAPASLSGGAVPAASTPNDPLPPLPDEPSLYFLEGLPPAVKPSPATQPLPSTPTAGTPAAFDVDGPLTEDVLSALPATLGGSPGFAAVPNATPPATAQPYFLDAPQTGTPSAGPVAAPQSFDFRPELVPDLGFQARPFDPNAVKRDFPILQQQVHGRPLVWLDNAATTQKPNAVIERLAYFYQHENSNIHRAAHELAARATDAYEEARERTRRFLNAGSRNEIVFVRGATEGINLIAQSWGRRNIEKDDEIVITWLEHHANIVPWQQLCAEKGARLKVAPVDDSGQIILEEYEKLFTSRTKLAAFPVVSNALGTVTPAKELVEIAHRHGARVLVDGAQSVSHLRADVQYLDCDWFVFSGHKVFGPTGIGAVYGKEELLNATPPWQGGGNMIADVTFEKTVYQPAPARFEAGTGNIADAVGLGAALDYLSQIGIDTVARYEHELLVYGTQRLLTVPGLTIIGTAKEKAGVLSFVLDPIRSEDVGTALNQEGIAVRAGHHCAQPILRRFGLESTVRASLALYNTCEDIDALVAALLRIQAGRSRKGI